MNPKTFVLVHGAWHGGWCWRMVAAKLEANGHRVFTPTLTGLGERAHLLSPGVNLSTHIEDVCQLIRAEDLNEVVLVGHSYGGMVVSGVAEKLQDRILSLVILDGFVPENGKSMSDYWPAKLKADWDAIAAKTGGNIPPILAENFGVTEERRAWVDQNCKPHPYASFTEKIQLNGGRDQIKNKLYIRATGWRSHAFDAFLKQLGADQSWRTISVDCGHEVMVDHPERLAGILEEAL